MPRQVLNALLLGDQSSTAWPGETPHHDFEDYGLWRARRVRHNHHAVSLTAAPPQGAPPPAPAQPPAAPSQGAPPQGGEGKEGAKGDESTMLEYQAENGKTIKLNGENEDTCMDSCKNAPEIKDSSASGGSSMMNMASGGEQAMVTGCIRFCQQSFEIQCFPASSTVVVRDQGRIPLSKLRLGDDVLVIHRGRSNDASDWALRFEPVISWLHYEPDKEMEVLQVHHTLGEVSLTPDHLLFVRRGGSGSVAAITAREVRVGDRVLAPWLDGCLVEPEVTEVGCRRATGAYCPLLPSGVLLVDSTAVSCYCLPNDLASSPVFAPMLRVLNDAVGRQSAHEAAHMLFLPVRLLQQVHEQWQTQLGHVKVVAAMEDRGLTLADKPTEPIHPYGLFFYVLAKSLTI